MISNGAAHNAATDNDNVGPWGQGFAGLAHMKATPVWGSLANFVDD
jgi:hypothetical protein